MNNTQSISGFIVNPYVVGTFFIIIQFLYPTFFNYISNKLKTRDPKYNILVFIGTFAVWLISVSIFLYASYTAENKILPIFCMLFSTAVFSYTVWNYFNQFWKLGIVGTDSETKNGLDYDKSLRLCQSSLSFHGIGASKLTRSSEFEDALLRCKQGKPIRFLLLDPKDENLLAAAKRANKAQNSYHEIVMDSLHTLMKLKENRELDIQVRFYSGKPLFRLMFVDDSLCLLSTYNHFGVGDGSNLPQVHLRNSTNAHHSKALYNSFDSYFEQLWKNSKHWDFKECLNERT